MFFKLVKSAWKAFFVVGHSCQRHATAFWTFPFQAAAVADCEHFPEKAKKKNKILNGWHNWIPRTQFSMQSEYFCTLVDTLGSVDTLKIDCCTLYSFSLFFLFCLWLPQNVSGCKMRLLPRRMCNVPHEMRLVGASPRIIYAISNLQKATKNCPTKYVYMYTCMYIYMCAA